jgi:hypothetical protein
MATYMKFVIAFLLLALASQDASAFWWLFRAGAARGAVGVGARTGVAVGAETTAAMARICVRPVGAFACDFRAARSAAEAVAKAVGPSYRVRATGQPNVFEVLDGLGNLLSLVESVSAETDATIANAPAFQPDQRIHGAQEYGAGPPVSAAPLFHNGSVINLNIGGTPTFVWSDGHIDVWADGGPRRALVPGERLHFPNHRTVHAVPRSQDAYTIFWQPSGQLVRSNPDPLSATNCPSGFQMINGRWTCMDMR